jgi:hypothetical protein
MAAADPDVGATIASGIVAANTTNLVLLFAVGRTPVSTHRFVCHWHRDADSRFVCAWEPDIFTYPASSIRRTSSNGS